MEVQGTVRIGKKGLALKTFESGDQQLTGTVFGLSTLGMGVPQSLVIRGDGDGLQHATPGTLLQVEGEQYQRSWKDGAATRYMTILEAFRVRVLSGASAIPETSEAAA